MQRTVYLNGQFLPEREARISIFDRAVLFGDALYEVAGVLGGKLIDFDSHMARYQRSLTELGITAAPDKDEILAAFRQLVEINQIDEGLVYLQVSRGEADREFVWQDGLKPNVFMFTQQKSALENQQAESGVKLKSVDDLRWARRDIKTVNLLGQVLAKKQAYDAGADEALMVDAGGFVTECGSSSLFLVKNDLLLTRPLSNDILAGVTRKAIVDLCVTHGIRLVQSRFRLADALAADEVIICSASSYLLPVVAIDDIIIGGGTPGNWYRKLRKIYLEHVQAQAI